MPVTPARFEIGVRKPLLNPVHTLESVITLKQEAAHALSSAIGYVNNPSKKREEQAVHSLLNGIREIVEQTVTQTESQSFTKWRFFVSHMNTESPSREVDVENWERQLGKGMKGLHGPSMIEKGRIVLRRLKAEFIEEGPDLKGAEEFAEDIDIALRGIPGPFGAFGKAFQSRRIAETLELLQSLKRRADEIQHVPEKLGKAKVLLEQTEYVIEKGGHQQRLWQVAPDDTTERSSQLEVIVEFPHVPATFSIPTREAEQRNLNAPASGQLDS